MEILSPVSRGLSLVCGAEYHAHTLITNRQNHCNLSHSHDTVPGGRNPKLLSQIIGFAVWDADSVTHMSVNDTQERVEFLPSVTERLFLRIYHLFGAGQAPKFDAPDHG